MIGNLKPKFKACEIEKRSLYMRSYCSICSSLRNQHGILSSVLVNNELSMLMSAIEPEMDLFAKKTKCPAKIFFITKPIYSNEVVDFISNWSLVLAWLKAIDNITDHSNKSSLKYKIAVTTEKWLQIKSDLFISGLPSHLKEVVINYANIIKDQKTTYYETAIQTGILSKNIAISAAQLTNAKENMIYFIGELFGRIGVIITHLDQLLDVNEDIVTSNKNPIIEAALKNNTSIKYEYSLFLNMYIDSLNSLYQIIEDKSYLLNQSFISNIKNTLKNSYRQLINDNINNFSDDEYKYLNAAACGSCDCDDSCSSCCEGGGCGCGDRKGCC